VKGVFCFDNPWGGREIVSRKRKDSKNREIAERRKITSGHVSAESVARGARDFKIFWNSRSNEILREDVRLDGWPLIKD